MHQEMKNRDSQLFVSEIIKSLDANFNELKYQFNNKRINTNTNYYFSKNSPNNYHYRHVTSFLGRPEQIFIRAYSRVDNYLRQTVSNILSSIK
jgi:hypothetical protein